MKNSYIGSFAAAAFVVCQGSASAHIDPKTSHESVSEFLAPPPQYYYEPIELAPVVEKVSDSAWFVATTSKTQLACKFDGLEGRYMQRDGSVTMRYAEKGDMFIFSYRDDIISFRGNVNMSAQTLTAFKAEEPIDLPPVVASVMAARTLETSHECVEPIKQMKLMNLPLGRVGEHNGMVIEILDSEPSPAVFKPAQSSIAAPQPK